MQPGSSLSEPKASTSIALRNRSRSSGFTRTFTHIASIPLPSYWQIEPYAPARALPERESYANGEAGTLGRNVTHSCSAPITEANGFRAPEDRLMGSVDADCRAEGFADRTIEHEVGDCVQAGWLAVYDGEGRAVVFRQFREGGRGINDQ